MNNRQLFQQYLAQTSPSPIGLEIVKAEGNYLYDADGKRYLDLIGGISVCNIGHSHPDVIAAIKDQADRFLHVMVYGELVQAPQSQYAQLLAQHLPDSLNCVYFTNSGSEATDGAMKLARRATGKTDIIACNKSYHGHTMGALSLMGDEYWRAPFRPLIPGIMHYDYNSEALIAAIDNSTAAVIVETVQAEAGVIAPANHWLQKLEDKCRKHGAILILDEIQCGFGRTGKLWGFQHYGVTPDIILLGKALGGGMPMGAFIASSNLMSVLTTNPVLGHITTFGGHPLCCAAGMAAFNVLLNEQLVDEVNDKAERFRNLLLDTPGIRSVNSKGLLMAVRLADEQKVLTVISACLQLGVFSDWFLFAADCLRIAPPLTITVLEIEEAATVIRRAISSH